jgi:transposase
MARAYSADMRQRVIDRVESGASRREAAEQYEVSPSTAVIWVRCFRGLAAVPPSPAVGVPHRWRSTRTFCWQSLNWSPT